jgi:hypothetical protein
VIRRDALGRCRDVDRKQSVTTLTVLEGRTDEHIYYDEGGHPMLGSALVRDPKFTDRVVAETRALLSTIPIQKE